MTDKPKRTDLTTSADKPAPLPPALPPVLPRGSSLLEQAFNRLPAEQQDDLLLKAVEKRIDIEVTAAEAEQGYRNFERESSEAVHQVKELSRTGMDIRAEYEGRTASGKWQVEARKSNYTIIMIVAAIIGIVAVIMAFR